MNDRINPELKIAREFVEFTQRNVFLTGKAGTGKTTFLRRLKKELPKRMVVVAPTGVAAINAGGVTIHSFFQLPLGPLLPGSTNRSGKEGRSTFRFSRQKIDIIRTLDLLVIDEISMVRADLLDGIDEVLRRYRKSSKPFGGIQLLMIGDLQQLAPVVKPEEWALLKNHYDSSFFFGSRALQQTGYVTIELKYVYRQQDEKFIEVLNMIRDNRLNQEGLDLLNACYRPQVLKNPEQGYITLTTHNYQARKINDSRLDKLPGKARKFVARVEGNFPESNYPTDPELLLKVGAQVMFIKNDSSGEKLYYNGKIGEVTGFSDDAILVTCDDHPQPIEVKPDRWDNVKYIIDDETKEIQENVEGAFIQYPLKTAWAITIHKSQGLTFEKAIIDANAAFAHGQVYVALSRCKSLEGLVLTKPLDVSALKTDTEVMAFVRQVEENPVDDATLTRSKYEFGLTVLTGMFDFDILSRQLGYLMRLINENKGALGEDLNSTLGEMKRLVEDTLKPVAEKFILQLKQLMQENEDVTNNVVLQERLKKACTWFYDQMKSGLLEPYGSFSIETDNKDFRKMLKQALDRLGSELQVKGEVFLSCRDGFTVRKYLEVRAKAMLDETSSKVKTMGGGKAVNVSVAHPELYARLKSWRDDMAEKANVPVYIILQVKSMKHIADRLPASLRELKTIPGLGKAKLEKYGPKVLEIIQAYCKEKKLTLVETDSEEIEPPKKPKPNTREITFQLFKKGKSIEEIAAERHLTVGTVYNHFCHYVRNGEVNVFQFVPSEKVKPVVEWLEKNKVESLSEIKKHFGEKISWDELRLIISHMAYLKDENGLKSDSR
ncbi:helix-turn-helix domain-containing protein [Thermophagus sp. OGC60D27]|uniref:helix-turn-helix domain-containing protein n=1 Tax=Thermophagus sp. OGC60D27 TaxID=3458415 RepID=UPI0040382AB4